MSSTPVLGFIKDIAAKKVKAVEDRLKKEKPNQKYIDPSQQNLAYTLLHKAVAVGSFEIAALLVKAGADVNSRDSKGKTPLHWLAALETDARLKIADLLLRQKAIDIQACSDSKDTPLHEAAAAGDLTFLQLLLSRGALATDTSPGYSPLHAACQGGGTSGSCRSVIALLLQQAPELLTQQDATGFTPLMRLLQRGAWADASELLGRGDCNINAQAEGGQTALLLACNHPAPDIKLVSALLTAGASAAVQDKTTGNTPLIMAVKLGGSKGLELAKTLLSTARPAADSDSVDTVNAAGESAVILAAEAVLASGQVYTDAAAGGTAAALDILSLLLEQKPQVPEQLAATLLEKGLSGVLSDAVTAQLVSAVSPAVVSQAAVAAKTPQPLTFSGLLSLKLYQTAVAYLVKTTGQHPGAPQDDAGNTHLHKAVLGLEDQPELVAALLTVGVPGNAVNKEGDTALHIAARAGHIRACRALVDGGADVTWRNAKNRTPGNQLKLPEFIKAYLQEAEEAAKLRKQEQKHQLWDGKMAATQTQSAFGIRVT